MSELCSDGLPGTKEAIAAAFLRQNIKDVSFIK